MSEADASQGGIPLSQPWTVTDSLPIPCHITRETSARAGLVTTPYGDLRFLNVSGNHADMAAELGRRLKDEALLGVVPYFSGYLERVLKNSPLGKASGLLDKAAHRFITRKLKSNVPRPIQDAIVAYSEATGIDLETLYRAYLMPDTFLFLVGTYHRLKGTKRAGGLSQIPIFGCTSAIATPPRSQTTLHARNFDYFGIDYWDKFATVVFHHPDDGLDYVSVSTAGIIGGGVTAMNAAGLTFVVHQHFPDRFDLSGVPVGLAGDEVMRHAHTIEEAVKILRGNPPVSGWTYIMTEGDTGRAAIFEVAPGMENLVFINEDEGAMGYANLYWGDELAEVEVDYYPEYRRCNLARQMRVSQCLRSMEESPSVEDMARILADLHDPQTGESRLLGPTILNVLTVASVVFEPESRRVWVAAGTSPTSRGWFIPFTLGAGANGVPDVENLPFSVHPGWRESPQGRAFQYYREAAILAQSEHASDDRLMILIEHALALHQDEPYLRVLAGLIALRLGRGLRAEGVFRRALDSISRPDRRAEIGLYLAWSLDLQGLRGAARHLYRTILEDEYADDVVKSRAKLGRWFRFTKDQAAALNIDFVYGGVP